MNQLFSWEAPPLPSNSNHTVGLVVTTYNRPVYLRRFLNALRRSRLKDTVLLLIDDGSTNPITKALLQEFILNDTPVIKAYRLQKNGCAMFENLRYGWDLLRTAYGCSYLCNLDPDTMMKREWLPTLRKLYDQEAQTNEPALITGFNAYQHPILTQAANYYQKESLGGINLFFDEMLYEQIVRPALVDIDWDWRVVRAMQGRGYRMLCTRPSVIQHIGREGVWSGKSSVFDFAIDYGSVNPLYTTLATLYFRGRRRAEWLLFKRQPEIAQVEAAENHE